MNTHTHIHTTRLLRFVSGVYVLKMWEGDQYEACLLTQQVGITLITSPPDFRFLRLHHMTGLSRHAATGRALPHGAIQNCPLRYRPSQKVETVCVCACVQVCACVYLAWNNEWLHCQLVNMHAVCVYARQVHTVSVLWRTAWICYHCTPCVFLCTFVTVKSRWSNKIINTRGILSTT